MWLPSVRPILRWGSKDSHKLERNSKCTLLGGEGSLLEVYTT